MGIFQKLFGKKEYEYTGQTLSETMNGFFNRYGVEVPELGKLETQLQKIAKYNVWVAGSIRAVVNSAIRPTMIITDGKNNIENHPFLDLLKTPNMLMDYTYFTKFNVLNYELDGNLFLRAIKSGRNTVALLPLPYDKVKVEMDRNGNYKYSQRVNGIEEVIPAEEMYHWKDTSFTTSYTRGTGRLDHALYSVVLDSESSLYNIGIIKNDATPSGILSTETKIDKEKAKEIKDAWKKAFGGNANKRDIAVLSNGISWQAVGMSLKDMAFEKLKDISRQEVIGIFQVPPVMLGLTDSVNYANARDQRRIFWELRMMTTLTAYADFLTHIMHKEYSDLNNYQVSFTYTGIEALQEEPLSKKDLFSIGRILGVNGAEIIRKLDLPFDVTEIETPQAPEEVEVVETRSIIIPDKVKSGYREYLKGLWIDIFREPEKILQNQIEKNIVNQRNFLIDKLKEINILKSVDPEIYNKIDTFLSDNKLTFDQYIQSGVLESFDMIEEDVVKRMLGEFSLEWKIESEAMFLKQTHINRITQINETTYKQILESTKNVIQSGADVGELERQIRGVFNERRKNARTIARTESNSMANDFQNQNYEANGIEKVEWLTAQDEIVRDTHAMQDGEIVNRGQSFMNGLKFPSDMSSGLASEVINCRCSLLPVVED
jgi:HK97 family phage portal protein